MGDGPGMEDEPIELQAAKMWSCEAQLQLKAQIDEAVEGWIGTGFGMIDDSKSKFLRVENVGTLKHMNLTSCASLIMSTGMINQQLLLEVIFTASTSLTNPFPKYCSFSKVAASEDKVAQAEALAQEAEKNPLPQEAGLRSMEVGSESHFFHHWGRGIVAVGGVSVVFGGKLTGVSG